MPWPNWKRRLWLGASERFLELSSHSLTFVASIDCARLPAEAAELGLPVDGRLLFFRYEGPDGDVRPGKEAYAEGFRVIYVPAGKATERRRTPQDQEAYEQHDIVASVMRSTHPYDRELLAEQLGEQVLASKHVRRWFSKTLDVSADEAAEPRTTPDGIEEYEAKPLVACLIRTFGSSDDDGEEEPEWFDVLQEALDELSYELTEPAGQVGGPPDSLQGPVEEEVAQAVADGQVRPELAGTFSHDASWLLLAHFYYERHDGRLYYLIQPDDLAARRFDKVMFTWQCT